MLQITSGLDFNPVYDKLIASANAIRDWHIRAECLHIIDNIRKMVDDLGNLEIIAKQSHLRRNRRITEMLKIINDTIQFADQHIFMEALKQ